MEKNEYLMRHDKVCTHLHYSICKVLGIETTDKWYTHMVYRVLVGKPEGKRPLGRPKRRWGIILGWISRRWDVGIWTGLDWPRIETGGGRL